MSNNAEAAAKTSLFFVDPRNGPYNEQDPSRSRSKLLRSLCDGGPISVPDVSIVCWATARTRMSTSASGACSQQAWRSQLDEGDVLGRGAGHRLQQGLRERAAGGGGRSIAAPEAGEHAAPAAGEEERQGCCEHAPDALLLICVGAVDPIHDGDVGRADGFAVAEGVQPVGPAA